MIAALAQSGKPCHSPGMARRRRHRKPLLPGFGSVVLGLLLLGAVGGLFWALGKVTEVKRVAVPTAPVGKKK